MPVDGAPERADAGRMGLELTDALGPDLLEAGDLVGHRALADGREGRKLGRVERDDELAGPLDRDAALVAVRLQVALALATEARLQRAGRVVQPGVEHAAVVAGLMARDVRLLLDERDAQVGVRLQEPERGRESEDPGADDADVGALGRQRPDHSRMARASAALSSSP